MSTFIPQIPDDGPEERREEHAVLDALRDRHRRRAILFTTVQTLFAVAVMITAFVVIPPGAIVKGDGALRLVLGVVLLVAVVAWQCWAIFRNPVPEFRAGAALVVLSVLLVLLFAMTYCAMSVVQPGSFSEPMSNSAAIYFTITTLATVGYGDIHAVTSTARWVVTVQMIIDLTLVVALGRVLVSAAKAGRARQSRAAHHGGHDEHREHGSPRGH